MKSVGRGSVNVCVCDNWDSAIDVMALVSRGSDKAESTTGFRFLALSCPRQEPVSVQGTLSPPDDSSFLVLHSMR